MRLFLLDLCALGIFEHTLCQLSQTCLSPILQIHTALYRQLRPVCSIKNDVGLVDSETIAKDLLQINQVRHTRDCNFSHHDWWSAGIAI